MENYDSLFDLSGKAAIVTGGARGLGRAIAEALAAHGANVAIVDIGAEEGEATAKEIGAAGGGAAAAFPCDVTDEAQVAATVDGVVRRFGKVDILVANAGIGDRAAAEEMTAAQWDRVLNINLKGVWLFNQAVGRHMIARGEGGAIINMASVTAVVGILTGNANYAAAKGGVAALTRTLAAEWGKHGIRVNAVAPAQVHTPLVDKLLEDPEKEAYFLNRIPLGRLGQPVDVAGPVVFLASQAAAWVTGHTLMVDGGNSIFY